MRCLLDTDFSTSVAASLHLLLSDSRAAVLMSTPRVKNAGPLCFFSKILPCDALNSSWPRRHLGLTSSVAMVSLRSTFLSLELLMNFYILSTRQGVEMGKNIISLLELIQGSRWQTVQGELGEFHRNAYVSGRGEQPENETSSEAFLS
ncbi:Proto-Oncogene C-Rel [Manis pentadactyla]|nr:Proto-Oncogene C-Rel [Manis pentadactyla]